MGTPLTGSKIRDTYKQLAQFGQEDISTEQALQNGDGDETSLSLSATSATVDGDLTVTGNATVADATAAGHAVNKAQMDALDGRVEELEENDYVFTSSNVSGDSQIDAWPLDRLSFTIITSGAAGYPGAGGILMTNFSNRKVTSNYQYGHQVFRANDGKVYTRRPQQNLSTSLWAPWNNYVLEDAAGLTRLNDVELSGEFTHPAQDVGNPESSLNLEMGDDRYSADKWELVFSGNAGHSSTRRKLSVRFDDIHQADGGIVLLKIVGSHLGAMREVVLRVYNKYQAALWGYKVVSNKIYKNESSSSLNDIQFGLNQKSVGGTHLEFEIQNNVTGDNNFHWQVYAYFPNGSLENFNEAIRQGAFTMANADGGYATGLGVVTPDKKPLMQDGDGNVQVTGDLDVQGTASVANATADDHAVNRVTGDGRWVKTSGIVNNLDSSSTVLPLSANQGKVLDGRLDVLESKGWVQMGYNQYLSTDPPTSYPSGKVSYLPRQYAAGGDWPGTAGVAITDRTQDFLGGSGIDRRCRLLCRRWGCGHYVAGGSAVLRDFLPRVRHDSKGQGAGL